MSAAPERDHITAGLELARAVLSGAVGAAGAVEPIREFHAAVVRSLLDGTAADQADLLSWARVQDGATLLTDLAALDGAEWAALEEAQPDLLSLAQQVAATGAAPAKSTQDGPRIAVRAPGGRWTTLTAHTANEVLWDTQVVKTAQVEKALHSVLGEFSLMWPEVWEEEIKPTHVCWPAGVELDTTGATLPVALWHLGRITGLGAPPVLFFGEMGDGRYLRDSATLFGKKQEEPGLTALVDAMKAERRELLIPGNNRWRWIRPEHPDTKNQDITVARPVTLDAAAQELWGTAWDQWKVERHLAELKATEWDFVDGSAPPEQPLPDIDTTQSFQLGRLFIETSRNVTAVLGGTPSSGKSCIIRCAVRTLRECGQDWAVVVLSNPDAKLPDNATAAFVAKHALGASGSTATRRLVVFEGLKPHDNIESHVSAMLRHVAIEANTCVLTVLEYNDNSRAEWDISGTTVITAPVGKGPRERFIEDLVRNEPTLKPGEERAHEAASVVTDLRQLTQLLNSGDDPFARIKARFTEMANSEREAVLLVAAMSLCDGAVADSSLNALQETDYEIFGVIPGRWPGTSALTGFRDCLSLIDLHVAERTVPGAGRATERSALRHEVLVELLEPTLHDLLKSEERVLAPRVPTLFNGIWLFNQKLAKDLAARAVDGGPLTSWAASMAPTQAVNDLLAVKHLFDDDATRTLAQTLVNRLRLPGEPMWRSSALMKLIRVVKNIDSDLTDRTLRDIAEWLKEQVEDLLNQQEGTPEELVVLLEALARYDWKNEEIKPFVADRTLDVLRGVRHDRLGDYRVVRKVVDLMRLLRARESIDLSALLVENEYDVKAMLEREPVEHDGIQVLFASIDLRQSFHWMEYELRFQPYHMPMLAALSNASATELATAINDLRASNPRLATALIGPVWPEFPAAVRRLLDAAWPVEAATLIRAISTTNSLLLPEILFKNGQVDQRLLWRLADKITKLRDTSSTGMLLSALHFADNLFHRGHELASTELAEKIGKSTVDMLIKQDPRMSSLYYLIKGIWDAEASYREEVLDDVLEIVANHVKRRRQHWGPLAALRLLSDTEMGQLALQGLREHLTPADLVEGMYSANTTQARAALHRLGRVLYPTVATMYRDRWDEVSFTDGLRTRTSALEVCAEAARTLVEADVPDAGRTMLAATGGVDEWAARLRTGGWPNLLATRIGDLSTLDRGSARQVLDKLRTEPTNTKVHGQAVCSLAAWLRKAMLIDASTTAAVINAYENVKPGLSKEVLAELAKDGYAAHSLRWSAAYDQNPISQAHTARALVRAGLTPNDPQGSWIKAVHEARTDTLNKFTNPQACAAILHMFAGWKEQWAADAAKSFDVTRMARRVKQGRITDLPGIIDLIRTLDVCGGTATARLLAEYLYETDLSSIGRQLDLENLCRLADVMEVVLPDAVPKVLVSTQVAVDAAITNTVVLDESKVWRHVARACATARRLRSSLGPFTDPEVRPNIVHAPAVAWAAAELGDPAWGANAAERVRARLNERDFPSPADQGYLLFATKSGWAPELRPVNEELVAHAPMWLLRMLSQESSSDPYLITVLKSAAPAIRKRMADPTRRSDWDARALSGVINTLAPKQSIQDVVRTMRTPKASQNQ
ncbi:hypothetical protein SK571_40095 [Lentzea sp. BCCO 10_0798]|uniref:Uncharacterized protein n=1 Tax=Lentzea kristufekii TaxID=3095430 RepID=A0ABU4U4X1_9PSEU|nr:hypothetical protein [Lentzea sp. BCCO 10_0798]MDX8055615.1 hypothetical protein [Lentzea sp. BCCO 10_0798]